MSLAMSLSKTTKQFDLEAVNRDLDQAPAERIVRWAVQAFSPRLAVSSSFGGQSAALLHVATRVWPEIPVLFINTGFMFPETLAFRDELVDRLKLNLVELKPRIPTGSFLARKGELYKTDPDACCAINKVEPMQRAVKGFDGWLSGIRRDQSPTRAQAPVVKRLASGLHKVSPIVNWSSRDVYDYLRRHKLPVNPLLEKGYLSIGCTHCTRPVAVGQAERSGRWAGLNKTECGLHTDVGEASPGDPSI